MRKFNFPYQVGTNSVYEGGVAERTHKIRNLDIIMAFSDGYADNVFPSQYRRCLEVLMNWTRWEETLTNFSMAADCQAKLAYVLSKKKRYVSPFS